MNSDALAARIENLLGSGPSSSRNSIPSRPPPPIPDHEICARIGGGSYGEVWLARSVTGAWRAVKVVWRCHFSSERPYEREFHGIVRFEPISRSHPGVVNVLHVGRDDTAGCFFYVMELADDASAVAEKEKNGGSPAVSPGEPGRGGAGKVYQPRTLASDLKSRGRLPVTDAVSLGVQLAGALGHLHRHGLVHRDVKPSNVIFVSGQPKLADIGLVTGVHEERSFVGTEGFIPPEGPGSESADLFALGRLLYEAAAGKNRCDFPGLPDDLDRWPKPEREALIELNEVLARACAPQAKQRHGHAADLAGDLNLVLAGRSVRRAYRVERQLRRATFISVVALVLVLATVFSNWVQRRQREVSDGHARREAGLRAQTEHSLARAEKAERESQQRLYTALLEQARALVLSGEMGQRVRALEAVRQAAAIATSADLRRMVLSALALPDLEFEREVLLAPDVTHVQLDPGLERMAVGMGRGSIEIRAAADNRVLATLAASTNLPSFHREWSADGSLLAVKRDYPDGARNSDWEIWDVAGGQRIFLLRQVYNGAFAFHPTRPRVLAANRTHGVALWDLEKEGEPTRFPAVGKPTYLRFSPDGERFAAASSKVPGMVVTVHDVAQPNAAALATSPIITEAITTFAWHPGGQWLAVPDHGTAVHRMDAQTGGMELIGRHKLAAVRAVFSPQGDYLFTGGWERELVCWNTSTRRREFNISRNSDTIQFAGEGGRCALLSPTKVELHRFERPAAHRAMAEDLGGLLRNATFSADGRWLGASGDKKVGLWDLNHGAAGVVGEEASNTILFFTSDGTEMFATRNPQGTPACFRWAIAPATNAGGRPTMTRLPLQKPAGFTSLSLVSNKVVMTCAKGSQLLAAPDSGAGTVTWAATPAGINGVSPDGRWLGIYRSYGASLYIHRLPGLERVTKLTHGNSISGFEFSRRGDEVAIYSSREPARVDLWSTATWQQTRTLTNFVRLLYAREAGAVWLTRDHRTAGLFDVRTLEPLLLLPTGVLPLALSPDGRQLAVSVDTRHLQLWDLGEIRERLRALNLDWTPRTLAQASTQRD